MPTVAKTGKRQKTTIDEGAVVAPMAGKIVSVNVQKGDAVKVGDVVCILEAMKMENEITAPKAGAIEEVHVAEGIPVNEGDLLVLIK
jgi:glutaconyl-CoA decarboxylase